MKSVSQPKCKKSSEMKHTLSYLTGAEVGLRKLQRQQAILANTHSLDLVNHDCLDGPILMAQAMITKPPSFSNSSPAQSWHS